jgi:hypothetical protein
MKDSTAIRKVTRVKETLKYLIEKLNKKPSNKQLLGRIEKLRAYAFNLIANQPLDPRPFKSMFFESEFTRLLEVTKKGSTYCYEWITK